MNWMRLAAGITLLFVVSLAGCARVNVDDSIARVNREAADFTAGRLSLAQNVEQRTAMENRAAKYSPIP